MKKTNLAWIIAIGFLIAYEAYTLLNAIPGDTLSEAVWRVASERPLIPFLAGVLCGHFFWQQVRGSSVAEQGAHNAEVEGAIPSPATNSGVAQKVEQYAVNVPVAGSNPAPGATFNYPVYGEGFVFIPYDEDVALKWANLKWLKIQRNP